MGKPIRVLIVEDSEDDTLLLIHALRSGGYDPEYIRVETSEQMRTALEQQWNIIISDYSLPQFDPLRALQIIQEKELDIPFIVVSGSVGEATILAAMKAGAADYLMKDNLMRLSAAVERELREAAGRHQFRILEDQMRQAQKMEAIGRLAGGVAHDFNNLLTVISGYSDLLLAENNLQPSDRMALQEVRKAAERGSSLTCQLLAFSRRQALAPRIVHLNELVTNMEKMLQRLIGEDVELMTVGGPDLGDVKIDPGQLEQVIMNIVVNARDAMPGGGKITVETSNSELTEQYAATHIDVKPGAYIMLAISDTGTGMSTEIRSHVFEPFFTTKEAGKGTGLGLATAYGIVKQSGGSIAIYSELGKGTTVRIYLPRADTCAGAELPEQQAKAAGGTETILLVEDEARVRRLIREILAMRGYSVLETAGGDEALRVATDHSGPIHLVLADVVMPEMSGPDLAKLILAARPEARALFVSGYTDEAIVHHGILPSDAMFLPKPFLPDALLRKIREVLDRTATDGRAQ